MGFLLNTITEFIFWPHYAACRILVPWPGIEPMPPELEAQVLTTGPLVKPLSLLTLTQPWLLC